MTERIRARMKARRSGDIRERSRTRADCHEEKQGTHKAMQNPPPGYTRVCPYLLYEDAARAVEYLSETFGFKQRRQDTGGAGRMHAELVLGDDGLVMLGQAGEGFVSPKRLGGYPPSLVHVYVDDVEGMHRRATKAQADVTELEMSPAGDRRFTATDPEGQVWVFAQRVQMPA